LGVEDGADVAKGGVMVVTEDAKGKVAGVEGVFEFAPGVVGIEGVTEAFVEGSRVNEVNAEVGFFVGAGCQTQGSKEKQQKGVKGSERECMGVSGQKLFH
jgi:hypothetical protein